MAILNDQQNRGLPAPPAPPRRGANPWRLSATARRPESVQPSVSPQLLEELMKKAPAGGVAARVSAPPGTAARRSRPGLIGLVMILIAGAIILRLFFDPRGDRDWVKFIGPLIFIAIVAHGLWRSRQQRDAAKGGSSTSREQ
jgi:hypothetical protein